MADWRKFKQLIYLLAAAAALMVLFGCSMNKQLLKIDQISKDGDNVEALVRVNDVIDKHPETLKPQRLKVDILLRMGKYEEALDLQKMITEEASDKWYAHYHLGLIYLEYMNSPEDAILPLEQALEIVNELVLMESAADKPGKNEDMEKLQDARYVILRGLVRSFQRVGRNEDALKACELLEILKPEDPWIKNTKSVIERNINKKKEVD